MRRAFVAMVTLLMTLVLVQPAAADPRSGIFTWQWGGDGPTCTLTASVSASPEDGSVVVRGAWRGCDGGFTIGTGDGVLSVSGEDRNGTKFGRSLSAAECIDSVCSTSIKMPYVGAGTYYGYVFVMDSNYVVETGGDPALTPASEIG